MPTGQPSDTGGSLPAQPPGPTPMPGMAGGPAGPARDAYTPTAGQFATLRTLLERYGLMDLYDTAVGWLVDGTADSEDRLLIALRETPQFRQRFRGMFDREAAGLPPISVNEYLAYEDQAYQLMRTYGYPPGFYDDPEDFADLIGANVSAVELEQRLAGYADVATLGRDTLRREMSRQMQDAGFGAVIDDIPDGVLAAFFADQERGLQTIRAMVQGAKVSAAAVDAGFGALSADEGRRLGGALDEASARQVFADLARRRELFGLGVGETETLGRDTAIRAASGDAAAQAAVEAQAQKRIGQFRRGGGYAEDREGIAGVGTS